MKIGYIRKDKKIKKCKDDKIKDQCKKMKFLGAYKDIITRSHAIYSTKFK